MSRVILRAESVPNLSFQTWAGMRAHRLFKCLNAPIGRATQAGKVTARRASHLSRGRFDRDYPPVLVSRRFPASNTAPTDADLARDLNRRRASSSRGRYLRNNP